MFGNDGKGMHRIEASVKICKKVEKLFEYIYYYLSIVAREKGSTTRAK